MEDTVPATGEQHFGDLTDPRIDRTKLHELMNMLVIAICAIIAGADDWEDAEEKKKPLVQPNKDERHCQVASKIFTIGEMSFLPHFISQTFLDFQS